MLHYDPVEFRNRSIIRKKLPETLSFLVAYANTEMPGIIASSKFDSVINYECDYKINPDRSNDFKINIGGLVDIYCHNDNGSDEEVDLLESNYGLAYVSKKYYEYKGLIPDILTVDKFEIKIDVSYNNPVILTIKDLDHIEINGIFHKTNKVYYDEIKVSFKLEEFRDDNIADLLLEILSAKALGKDWNNIVDTTLNSFEITLNKNKGNLSYTI